jgi:3-oxoacyl-[acyl-carrier protein] reductase
VNNAGTAIPKPFEETTLEEMDRVIDINIRGVFVATQAALKHMHEGGRIISIGSSVVSASRRRACALRGHKGAVKMFTQALARNRERASQSTTSAGSIETDLNPATGDWRCRKGRTALNRYGQVDEIAAMVAFVAGPEASYITGQLTVDGGMNA